MTALDEDIQKGIEAGFTFKADTIERPANKISIKSEKLIETIKKVDHFTDQKNDADFNRKPEHLVKFDTENGSFTISFSVLRL